MERVRSGQAMIAGMNPVADPADYCFVTVPEGYRSRRIAEVALASFLEDEGWRSSSPRKWRAGSIWRSGRCSAGSC